MKAWQKLLLFAVVLTLAFIFEPGRQNYADDFVASNWLLVASEEDLSAIPDEDTVVMVEGHILTNLSTEGRSVLLSWLEKGIPIAASGRQIYPTMVSDLLGVDTNSHYGTGSPLVADGLFKFEGQYFSFHVAGYGSTNDRLAQSIRSMVSGHKQFLKRSW